VLERQNLPNQWSAGAKKVDSLATVFASQVLARLAHKTGKPPNTLFQSV
jgi:hypothetical protein